MALSVKSPNIVPSVDWKKLRAHLVLNRDRMAFLRHREKCVAVKPQVRMCNTREYKNGEGHHEHPSTSAVRYQGYKEGKRRVCRNSDDNHEIFLWQCFDKLNRLTHYLRMNKTAEAEKKQKNADP